MLHKWLHEKRYKDLKEKILAIPKEDWYKIYDIREHKGHRRRRIEEPIKLLKKFQQRLIPSFEKYPLHEACMARRGRSIADNAEKHEGSKYILKVDIKQCYVSIDTEVLRCTLLDYLLPASFSPFLIDAYEYCLIEINGKYVLPTGAPTSPILCNIALTSIDHDIDKLAEEYGYIYTRYMDDIHLSTKDNKREWNLLDKVREIIESYSYQLNNKKTRWLTGKTDKVIVTGVRLGKCSKVPKEFRRMLRAKLQNLAKNKKPIDPETRGCLAYVQSIDQEKYKQMTAYYKRRLSYEGPKPH